MACVRLSLLSPSSSDPVPPAQIRATSVSITPSWCNVTLECGATGALDVLDVTWGSKGLPTELEQRGTPGSTDPGTLAVSLPLSQPNVSLTCVVSNPVDQKNATVDLVDICSQGECNLQEGRGILQELRWHWRLRVPGFFSALFAAFTWSLQPRSVESQPAHICL